MNFGWNLLDVLNKSKVQEVGRKTEMLMEEVLEIVKNDNISNTANYVDIEWNELEIGTWSNDMINMERCDIDPLIRYASPTSWVQTTYDNFSDSIDSFSEDTDFDENSECGGIHIKFTDDNVAEVVYSNDNRLDYEQLLQMTDSWKNCDIENTLELQEEFLTSCFFNEQDILSRNVIIPKNTTYKKLVENNKENVINTCKELDVDLVCPELNMIHTEVPVPLANNYVNSHENDLPFSFDMQPNLSNHPGPSPSIILQALTMSNANDGINLERLETIGDSFLKYAITDYLYTKYENVHEGKLSHLRSKQVSNLNLYRLGKQKNLGECMIATKFDPHDNWLPPCFYVPKELEEALVDDNFPTNNLDAIDTINNSTVCHQDIYSTVTEREPSLELPSIIPYNLVTQHSIPDKSIADCVEALIGSYLIECGPHGALLFMAWLGIRVLPKLKNGKYGNLGCPKSPLLRNVPDPEGQLHILLDGYDKFEKIIGYNFNDKSYLLQSLTHASYSPNNLTDCYQRLEFLGDAVLDYLITRHLYEDSRMHSPGALTDLRSALVNNTIFASLAVRNGFHRYFRHMSPGLHEVIERFIHLQEESGHMLVEELYLLAEHECDEVEDVEVPKALGDVFESVAGAIYLDSSRSLDAVWKVYYRMMQSEIEQFSNRVPKSPIRELLELEPETAKFGTPEKLADGRRVRVTVQVFGKGSFKGIGRNYRIAKCTAAKCALRHLKKQNLLKKKNNY